MFEIFGLFHLAALLRRADYMRDRKILGGHIYRKQSLKSGHSFRVNRVEVYC